VRGQFGGVVGHGSMQANHNCAVRDKSNCRDVQFDPGSETGAWRPQLVEIFNLSCLLIICIFLFNLTRVLKKSSLAILRPVSYRNFF
jgi:hypothetical protein